MSWKCWLTGHDFVSSEPPKFSAGLDLKCRKCGELEWFPSPAYAPTYLCSKSGVKTLLTKEEFYEVMRCNEIGDAEIDRVWKAILKLET